MIVITELYIHYNNINSLQVIAVLGSMYDSLYERGGYILFYFLFESVLHVNRIAHQGAFVVATSCIDPSGIDVIKTAIFLQVSRLDGSNALQVLLPVLRTYLKDHRSGAC